MDDKSMPAIEYVAEVLCVTITSGEKDSYDISVTGKLDTGEKLVRFSDASAIVANQFTQIERLKAELNLFKGIGDMWLHETVNEREEHKDARTKTVDAFQKSALDEFLRGGA